MASTRSNLPALGDDSENDPFVTSSNTPPHHHRFSSFDHDLFAAGPGSSPRQAKRALEAHLAETERRLDEAGKLGTALVAQRKNLTEKLSEVDKMQAEGELGPDLRQKLVEIEREYNDLARESARAFLPKQRVPSNEPSAGSPFDGRSGRRSVSPSKFESQAIASPTKLSVPNRKIRNQPSNRVHDIEFAAEISTSLIAQVRNLQSLLAERDEEVRDLKSDKSTLEIESENLHQRLRALDESENRYKEENWNLETRLQELASQQREAGDREKKLAQALSTANAEKNAAQKELDEVKASHSKLTEDHAATVKHHDIELGTAKRSAVMAEGERATLQRKIDDLTSQNQELAKAFSTQRGRTTEREAASGQSEDDLDTATGNITPEHSPPPSPVKGTPRHAMLEAETIKTSLHHAQRTIQSQRSLIHREKTEKLELRRIVQDLRDDLERARGENAPSAAPVNRRARKVESVAFKKPEFKKPQSRLLGTVRSSRQEVFIDEDPEWEDQQGPVSPNSAPTAAVPAGSVAGGGVSLMPGAYQTDASDIYDHFDTANDASESAFETANERATETDDFQTANERSTETDDFQTANEHATETDDFQTGNEGVSLSDEDDDDEDDGAATETETTKGFGGMRTPNLPAGLSRHASRPSFDSTASTSADEDDFDQYSMPRTPTATLSSKRSRLQLGRASMSRSSRQGSEEPAFRSSPVSVASGTPIASGGQTLFAELQDFDDSEDDSVGILTPSRRSTRSLTPASTRRAASPVPALPPLPKVIMVDSSAMTDPIRPEIPNLSISTIQSETVEPREEIYVPPVLGFTSVVIEAVEPVAEPVVLPPALSLSTISAEDLQPVAEPETPPPALSLSVVSAEHVEPVEEPETPLPELSMSVLSAEHVEPVEEPETPPPALSLSVVSAEHVEPVEEPETPLPELSMSILSVEHVEPVEEPVTPHPAFTLTSILAEIVDPEAEPAAPLPALSMSDVLGQQIEPVEEPEPEPEHHSRTLAAAALAAGAAGVAGTAAALTGHSDEDEKEEEQKRKQKEEEEEEERKNKEIEEKLRAFTFTDLVVETVEPVAEPEVEPEPVPAPAPELGLSAIYSEYLEPVAEPEVVVPMPELGLSAIYSEYLEPRAEPEVILEPVPLGYSTLLTQQVEPVAEPEPALPALGLSSIAVENVAPVVEPPPTPPTLGLSSIAAENVAPVVEPPPRLVLSSITGEAVEPMVPIDADQLPDFGFTSISSVETRPLTPRSPWRDGFVLPKDREMQPEAVVPGSKSLLGSVKARKVTPIIAEDETRQSVGGGGGEEREQDEGAPPSSRQPFKEISANANPGAPRSPAKKPYTSSDQGAQTSLTSKAIDHMLLPPKSRQPSASPTHNLHSRQLSAASVDTSGTTGTVRVHRSPERTGSPTPNKGKSPDGGFSDSGSLVEANRAGSAGGASSRQGNMGPPLWPASVLKQQQQQKDKENTRPTTPSQQGPVTTIRTTPALRVEHSHHPAQGNGRESSLLSRQSSVSSFVSELDSRFNMRPGEMMDPTGLGPNTDPRMIQAITQTMIGEYLWKYTRKTGRADMSEKRHRRYFWVHPYTRTLYWSDSDPTTAGRTERKAKSVPIEAVRVVTDDNPMPPGLHRKSLIIISTGRTIKFTCTTGQRHETWFNALSYLLLRTNTADSQSDAEDVAGHITKEDVDEFNPPFGQHAASGHNRPRPPPSFSSSYNSGSPTPAYGAPSPAADTLAIPTLTPSKKQQSQQQRTTPQSQRSSIGKLSGYWRTGGSKFSGTLSSLRSRSGAASVNQDHAIYQTSDTHDSAEDLREMIERQDREADKLENVRACCD
ncbi:Chromosome segregation ATPase, partial [Geosmithia morbida]